MILGETITWLDWLATGIITVGIVFSTAFGSHCSLSYTVDEIMDFFEAIPFIVAECIFLVSMVASFWWVTWGAKMVCSDQVTIDRSCSVVFGYCAGAVGGQQQVFLKATGELFESTFNGKSEWNRWEATMFAVACIVLAVGQIQLLNKGLCLWSAIKYLPIYNVCLILCSTTYGGIFYQEYKVLSTLGMIMFPFGVFIVVLGATVLACKNSDSADASKVVMPWAIGLERIVFRDASGEVVTGTATVAVADVLSKKVCPHQNQLPPDVLEAKLDLEAQQLPNQVEPVSSRPTTAGSSWSRPGTANSTTSHSTVGSMGDPLHLAALTNPTSSRRHTALPPISPTLRRNSRASTPGLALNQTGTSRASTPGKAPKPSELSSAFAFPLPLPMAVLPGVLGGESLAEGGPSGTLTLPDHRRVDMLQLPDGRRASVYSNCSFATVDLDTFEEALGGETARGDN
eukprot:TRINITY_DN547_c0_g1_i1.p1 TRINITY_DN547_c0_g1~~TRINITY_DN547_c0_g1_i1.p1  ORF type:complete len:457 (-),score=77.38 TRINITY_DN547_c0_g1_i1:348-1718(-)